MTEPTRPCGTCGMPCTPGEYHPYAACLMFKACRNSETVRANLEAVRGTPPAVAGDTIIEAPSSYQWITEPGSVEHFGIPGQVRKVVANVATPQPAQAQAGAVPLTKEQRSRIVLTADTVSEAIDMVERHYGIKGGQS